MKLAICSDGTASSDNAVRIGSLIARAAAQSEIALLGVAEEPQDEQPLRNALEKQAETLRQTGAKTELQIGSGEPIVQILAQTSSRKDDLVIVGARAKEASGLFWRSQRTYELIRAITPPVLVAIGDCQQFARFLVCTGGKIYIDAAVKLTASLAASLGAEVTLLHVMAEPPAVFADLVEMEEDVDSLLASGSELGRNLSAQKQTLEKMGVKTQVRVRHGLVVEQVFAESSEGTYDLIVSGSSRARGPLQHYIMGDVTRSILNQADCSVLVARSGAIASGGFWTRLRQRILGS